MKVLLDDSLCVGHGRCYELGPDVFSEDDHGHCQLLVDQVSGPLLEQARRGADNCPERAITLADD